MALTIIHMPKRAAKKLPAPLLADVLSEDDIAQIRQDDGSEIFEALRPAIEMIIRGRIEIARLKKAAGGAV